MLLILTLNICNDYPKYSSRCKSMEQEKNKLILMKDNKETTSHSFFIRTILKEQLDLLENKKNIRTINAEINKKTFYPSLENRNVL